MEVSAAAKSVLRVPARTWRFLRRWPVIPLFILGVMVVFAIFPHQIAPYDPLEGELKEQHIPPIWYPGGSSKHILGTDFVGRDLLSRVIHGARVSLKISAVALSAGIITGTALGLISGYFGGLIDEVCMRLIDLWASIPPLMVGMIAAVVLGASDVTLMGVLALQSWSAGARNVRAEVLSLKTRDYVSLAKVSGASTARIMVKHMLPGVVNTVMVIATLAIGGLIMSEAFLSYMGAGVPSPTPAWGLMTSEGKDYLTVAWWDCFFPGLAIFLTVMSLNFLGDWTRDRLDPRLRQL